MRLKDLAQERVSYGYRRLHILLQREGWAVNHKRVYRLYREEGLMLRTKKPKRHVSCQCLLPFPCLTLAGLMMPVSSTLVDAGSKPVYPFGATRTAGRVSYCRV